MNFLLKLFILAAAVLVTAYILPGFEITAFWAPIVAALLLSLINALIRPVLVILTLPITVVTLGLFLLIINAFLLWLVSVIVEGFVITTFGWALVGSLIITIVSGFLNAMVVNRR